MEEARPPTKKLCSCGADLSSLSVYHVRKHLAGSDHLRGETTNQLKWHCVWQFGNCGPVGPTMISVSQIHADMLEMISFNPLTTEFFPPRQHIFMHSAHTTFVGTPLPQHSLLSGQTWWGPHTWRDPSGNTVNDIHDPPQAQQWEVKGGCQPDFRPAFP